MWRNWSLHTLLVGMYNGAALLEGSLTGFFKKQVCVFVVFKIRFY